MLSGQQCQEGVDTGASELPSGFTMMTLLREGQSLRKFLPCSRGQCPRESQAHKTGSECRQSGRWSQCQGGQDCEVRRSGKTLNDISRHLAQVSERVLHPGFRVILHSLSDGCVVLSHWSQGLVYQLCGSAHRSSDGREVKFAL